MPLVSMCQCTEHNINEFMEIDDIRIKVIFIDKDDNHILGYLDIRI